jgi:2-keto-4-pentenoate hydratase/2-oxohepta-3-ene-1,7-dioic acid hydratase in catechol pathway
MRFARVHTERGPVPAVWRDDGWAEVDSILAPVPRLSGRSWPASAALAAPCVPTLIVGMSANGTPASRDLPARSFLKSPRTAIGPSAPIHADTAVGGLAVEGELAVVMAVESRHLTPERALESVLGYTIANDVTAVEQIAADPTFTHGKNGDGFTPLGPWIETDLDPAALGIEVAIDGVVVATGNTADLGRAVAELLAYVTSVMTLGPGDVVLTGCPGSTAPIEPGQSASIRIDGLGELVNQVTRPPLAVLRQETR